MIQEFVDRIKNANTDTEIKRVLFDVYVITQVDSSIRKEFDKLGNDLKL